MPFISYAQNFEDVILHRALKSIKKGFYIDVGANDPVQDSVTKSFYDLGWSGINIEPIDEWFDKIKIARQRDINLKIAAGSEPGEITIYNIPKTGLSTVDQEIANRHARDNNVTVIANTVPMCTLTDICVEHDVKDIHFLKIDVEGAEKQVVEGFDLTRFRPWIIVLESTLPNLQTENYSEWEPLLLDTEYEFVYFDGLNRFYLAKEHQDLKQYFATPPNYFDHFMLHETQTFCWATHANQNKNKHEEAIKHLSQIFEKIQVSSAAEEIEKNVNSGVIGSLADSITPLLHQLEQSFILAEEHTRMSEYREKLAEKQVP